MDDNKEFTIRKSSALIQTNATGITLTQRRLINAFLYIAQKEGEKKKYTYPTSSLKEVCGISMKGNNELKENLRKLAGIVIEFNYLGKDQKSVWEITSLISYAKIDDRSHFTEFSFSECIREKIMYPNMYAPLNIVLIASLKSTYSIVLYEILKDYSQSPAFPGLTITQLRSLLGVGEKKYKEFQNFKKRVLMPAVAEINEKTDIFCEYDLVKSGRQYTSIIFKVKANESFKKTRNEIKSKNLHLFLDNNSIHEQVINALPEEYRINTVYNLIEPYFDDLEFLVSNIKYANINCDKNYSAYLKLALKNDYAKVNREVKEKKDKIVQDKKTHIQEKKNQEKVLKQKVWNHFNSLPEGEQFKFRSDAEEKMSAALKFIKIPEGRKDIINAQIEKDMFAELKQERKV